MYTKEGSKQFGDSAPYNPVSLMVRKILVVFFWYACLKRGEVRPNIVKVMVSLALNFGTSHES